MAGVHGHMNMDAGQSWNSLHVELHECPAFMFMDAGHYEHGCRTFMET